MKNKKRVLTNEEKSLRSENGITLIALVITIIVLLILAEISVLMISGDNSIIQKATEAKTLTENKSREEQIKLEVMGSIGTDGKIDVAILKTNLGKIGATATGNSLPLTVTSGEQQFIINSNGVVTLMEPVTLEAILGWISNDDVCEDIEKQEFTEKLKKLGPFDWGTGWSEAFAYRCSVDGNIYIVGIREGHEEKEMQIVYWDGTVTYDNEGKPVTLSTSFGNFSNDLLTVTEATDENDNLVYDSMYIYPPFNANCILRYSYEGKVTSVEWAD